jgi:lysophospholipase L1-like esterase
MHQASPSAMRRAGLPARPVALLAAGALLAVTALLGAGARAAAAAAIPVGAAPGTAATSGATPLDLLAVGDSITEGMFSVDPGNAYFPRLAAWLADGGMPASDRLAVPHGSVVDAVALADAIREKPARLVVIELGSNDAPLPRYGAPTPADVFERDYRAIVDAARAADPGVRLVLVGLWGQAHLRPVYDGIIRRIAADSGGVFVELGALADDPDLRGPAGRPTPQGISDEYHPNDVGHGAIAQRLREAVAPFYGLDATPPRTLAARPSGWVTRAVTVRLSAHAGAAKVVATRYRVDGGAWRTGTTVRIRADGAHVVRYYSVDAKGDTEPLRRCAVRIDRVAPTTRAAGTVRTAPGRTVRLGLRLTDPPAPDCLVRLEVLREGIVVARKRVGRVAPGTATVPWTCALRPGDYRYRFAAEDRAGNRQTVAVSARLIVN